MSAPTTQLVSGEGVAFALDHASFGSRLIAALIDLTLQCVLAFILIFATGLIVSGASDAAIATIILVEMLLVFLGYPTLSEWLGHGKTVGKLCLGLRAVRDDGGPLAFRQAFIRGLTGMILEKPGLLPPISTGIGVITMLTSPQDKRIGDMMAGTFVLNERGGPRRSLVARDFAPPPHLVPWAVSLDLSRVDDGLALAVRQFVVRANDFTPAAQQQLGEDLRSRVCAVIAPPPPPGTPTPWVLVSVLAERRRRTEPAMPAQPYPVQQQPSGPAQQHPAPQSYLTAPPAPPADSPGSFVPPS
jgi:uncharacterized RDD family membrane protein YckC